MEVRLKETDKYFQEIIHTLADGDFSQMKVLWSLSVIEFYYQYDIWTKRLPKKTELKGKNKLR